MRAVDLFAGAGGFSTGAVQAGCTVVWAGNHWQAAVDAHKANHPTAAHACQDLHQQDWRDLPEHDLMLASPSCTGHTPARGEEKPHHDAARSTAWAVVSAAECHRPQAAIVENVPAFQTWALFPAWKLAMESLGYAIAPHLIDAADHGVPQHRVRLFLVCTKSKSPLWLKLPQREHVPISTVLDFTRGKWSNIVKPGRSVNTLARIANGRARFGDRFLAPYYGSGSGTTGRSIDRPVGTITTRDRWALIDGDRMRMLTTAENRDAMGFPSNYILPNDHKLALHMLGNAVPPPVPCDIITALKQQQ